MNGGVRILPFLTASVAVHALVIAMLGAQRLTLATAPTGAGHEVSIRLEGAAPTQATAATTPQPAPEPEPESAPRPVATTPAAETPARAAAPTQAPAVDTAGAATTAAAGEWERSREARPPRHANPRPSTQPEERVAETGKTGKTGKTGDGATPTRSNASASEVRDAIVARLTEHFRYPPIAQRRGWQGTVVLSVRILPDGRLSDISVKQSSGRALLDRSATESLGRVKRIPQLADRIGASGLALEIPVTYRLEAA